jgi:hypothetical protein
MEPIYWHTLAYIVGSVIGYIFGRQSGLTVGIVSAIDSLIDGGFVKTKEDKDGDIELIKLTWEERHGTSKSETS